MVDNGYAHRILLSHDIHSKHRLVLHYINYKLSCINILTVVLFPPPPPSTFHIPTCTCVYSQVRYGGHGYGHILENIVPKMEDRGIPRAIIDQILTENPQKWLPFL